MSKESKFKRHLSETLDLPMEIILDSPIVNIIANNKLTIENHKGILEYTSNILRMKSTLGVIKVIGDNLKIMEIDQSDIVVCGEILSVEFQECGD